MIAKLYRMILSTELQKDTYGHYILPKKIDLDITISHSDVYGQFPSNNKY